MSVRVLFWANGASFLGGVRLLRGGGGIPRRRSLCVDLFFSLLRFKSYGAWVLGLYFCRRDVLTVGRRLWRGQGAGVDRLPATSREFMECCGLRCRLRLCFGAWDFGSQHSKQPHLFVRDPGAEAGQCGLFPRSEGGVRARGFPVACCSGAASFGLKLLG
ncbi:hypothetical protein TcG_08589 [Trypanosoma cruzi]|nr:hypothetical protein TcG_08589 [Trypanosoma cruzi]